MSQEQEAEELLLGVAPAEARGVRPVKQEREAWTPWEGRRTGVDLSPQERAGGLKGIPRHVSCKSLHGTHGRASSRGAQRGPGRVSTEKVPQARSRVRASFLSRAWGGSPAGRRLLPHGGGGSPGIQKPTRRTRVQGRRPA